MNSATDKVDTAETASSDGISHSAYRDDAETRNRKLRLQATRLRESAVWKKRQDIVAAAAISKARLYAGRVLALAAVLTVVCGINVLLHGFNFSVFHDRVVNLTRLAALPLLLGWPVSWFFYLLGYRVGTSNTRALCDPQASTTAVGKALHQVTRYLPSQFARTGLLVNLAACATLPITLHLCVASLLLYPTFSTGVLEGLADYMAVCVVATIPAHAVFIGSLNKYIEKNMPDSLEKIRGKFLLGVPCKCAAVTCLFTLFLAVITPYFFIASLIISLLVFITGVVVIAVLHPFWKKYHMGLTSVRQWNADFASCPEATDPAVWQFLHRAPKDFHRDI